MSEAGGQRPSLQRQRVVGFYHGGTGTEAFFGAAVVRRFSKHFERSFRPAVVRCFSKHSERSFRPALARQLPGVAASGGEGLLRWCCHRADASAC